MSDADAATLPETEEIVAQQKELGKILDDNLEKYEHIYLLLESTLGFPEIAELESCLQQTIICSIACVLDGHNSR